MPKGPFTSSRSVVLSRVCLSTTRVGEDSHVKANRSVWSEASGWTHEEGGAIAREVDLALVFGSTAPMIEARLSEIRARYPNAYVCGGTTAGEIVGKEVRDDSVVVT